VQRPFYPEGDTCHAVLLHPPAGIVGGDELTITVDCSHDASALITTPGATRFYGSDGRTARQNLILDVADSSLEWLPMETLYFNQCIARQSARVQLTQQSRFIGWEISCFGRIAGDFPFVDGRIMVDLQIELEGEPLLLERLNIDGGDDIHRSSGLRGSTVSATMIAIAPSFDVQHCLTTLREALPAEVFAATEVDGLLVLRYLGANSEQAKNGFIDAWRLIRPRVLQKPACAPRIWAT